MLLDPSKHAPNTSTTWNLERRPPPATTTIGASLLRGPASPAAQEGQNHPPALVAGRGAFLAGAQGEVQEDPEVQGAD